MQKKDIYTVSNGKKILIAQDVYVAIKTNKNGITTRLFYMDASSWDAKTIDHEYYSFLEYCKNGYPGTVEVFNAPCLVESK